MLLHWIVVNPQLVFFVQLLEGLFSIWYLMSNLLSQALISIALQIRELNSSNHCCRVNSCNCYWTVFNLIYLLHNVLVISNYWYENNLPIWQIIFVLGIRQIIRNKNKTNTEPFGIRLVTSWPWSRLPKRFWSVSFAVTLCRLLKIVYLFRVKHRVECSLTVYKYAGYLVFSNLGDPIRLE